METVFRLAGLISTKPFATLCVGLIASYSFILKNPTFQLNIKARVKNTMGKTYPLQILNNCVIQQMIEETQENILLKIFSLLMSLFARIL